MMHVPRHLIPAHAARFEPTAADGVTLTQAAQ
jgi:hypothetical protein